MFALIILFTVAMITVFCFKGSCPDELIIAFFAFWGVEGGAMAWIKNTETKRKKKANKKETDTK